MRYVALLGAATGMSHDGPTNFLSMWLLWAAANWPRSWEQSCCKKKTPKKMLFSPLILLIKRVSVQSTIHHILVDI
jgi:hypothetical protein